MADHRATTTAPRLPREIEADPCHDAVQAALAARTRRLWLGGTLVTSVVPLSDALRRVLADPDVTRLLRRGLEAAESALAAERRGLSALPPAEARRHGARVSRLLLLANDGAERFYRQVERLVAAHAPRVLACVVDCDSATLGALLYDRDAIAKLVLAEHKSAVAAILRALAGGSPAALH
jgi:hypothetical protein